MLIEHCQRVPERMIPPPGGNRHGRRRMRARAGRVPHADERTDDGRRRLLLSHHAGRTSGNAHRIEIWYAAVPGTLYLMAGGGMGSDWVRNLVAEPAVTVELAGTEHRRDGSRDRGRRRSRGAPGRSCSTSTSPAITAATSPSGTGARCPSRWTSSIRRRRSTAWRGGGIRASICSSRADDAGPAVRTGGQRRRCRRQRVLGEVPPVGEGPDPRGRPRHGRLGPALLRRGTRMAGSPGVGMAVPKRAVAQRASCTAERPRHFRGSRPDCWG